MAITLCGESMVFEGQGRSLIFRAKDDQQANIERTHNEASQARFSNRGNESFLAKQEKCTRFPW